MIGGRYIVLKNIAFCSEIERSIDRLLFSLPNALSFGFYRERQSLLDGLPGMQAPLSHPLPPLPLKSIRCYFAYNVVRAVNIGIDVPPVWCAVSPRLTRLPLNVYLCHCSARTLATDPGQENWLYWCRTLP